MIGQKFIDRALRDLALRMALHCVRNTVIEDYHSQGKLSDEEMKAFNKDVVNKLYSFLRLVLSPAWGQEREAMMKWLYRPKNWDNPELDEGFVRLIKLAKKHLQMRNASAT